MCVSLLESKLYDIQVEAKCTHKLSNKNKKGSERSEQERTEEIVSTFIFRISLINPTLGRSSMPFQLHRS